MSDIIEEAREALEGVTPGPWLHDGEPWNLIVWDGNGNRVCFMAHSNGLNDARDVATARFIVWCREGVPALIAHAEATEAALTAERAKVAALVEALTPFANALKGKYSHQSDELPISMGHAKYDLRWVLPLGDFRRALTVITEVGQ